MSSRVLSRRVVGKTTTQLQTCARILSSSCAVSSATRQCHVATATLAPAPTPTHKTHVHKYSVSRITMPSQVLCRQTGVSTGVISRTFATVNYRSTRPPSNATHARKRLNPVDAEPKSFSAILRQFYKAVHPDIMQSQREEVCVRVSLSLVSCLLSLVPCLLPLVSCLLSLVSLTQSHNPFSSYLSSSSLPPSLSTYLSPL
jgi:hypothetical protein